MTLKEIRDLPFTEFHKKNSYNWKAKVREPMMDGERLLVVDFLKNEKDGGDRGEEQSFRIVCAKKSRWVKGITAENKVNKKILNILRDYWEWDFLIEEKEKSVLQRFLGRGSAGSIAELSEWVKETIEEMEKKERLKRGGLPDEDYLLCPEDIPEGLVDFVRREVLPEDNTLVYKKGNVRGICYACGQEVRAGGTRFTQNLYLFCPNCGEWVHCVLEDGANYKADYVDNVVIAQKGTDGQTVFFRQFHIIRDSTARWENIEQFLNETARYAIRGDKTAKWQREKKTKSMYKSERYTLTNWTLMKDNGIYDNEFCFCAYGIEKILAGTKMQYADLEGYMNSGERMKNHIYFLEYHAKYPVVEFLWKAGYHKLVHQRIWGMDRENRNAILWNRKVLKECFRFPLRFLKLKDPSEWDMDDVLHMNILYNCRGGNIKEEEARLILQEKTSIRMVKDALPYAGVRRIFNYIKKQIQKEQEAYEPRNKWDKGPTDLSVTIAYRDYLQECQQLELPLTEREILFPRDLKAAHERTAAMVDFEKNKADQKKFQKVVDSLEKYAWQSGDYLIRPAREQQELSEEGQALHHCVGGYIKRMANGETAIFFVRKVDEPDKPFYTLELCGKEVWQCHTDHNTSYSQNPAVKAFVDSWMEEVVKKGSMKKKKSKEDAA